MSTARNEIREKVLAHLISMTEQLKYLQVERFEWLLHVVQYASNELRTNALITVRYAAFCLPSCHRAQHVAVFQQDICQLVEKLKEFTFLDIYGEILYEKVESYRSMVQARFPNSRIDVGIARFRLWL
ncbi:unnamed protein product [Rotaria sp. Silwood1]|nr:unnamed protein product [Rotaria sp. Silwood1]